MHKKGGVGMAGDLSHSQAGTIRLCLHAWPVNPFVAMVLRRHRGDWGACMACKPRAHNRPMKACAHLSTKQ